MSYTSLEQRTAQGYLDLFPPFIPDEQAAVGVLEQKVFYDLMGRLYQLAYDEPQLFIPKLHEDEKPPGLYSGASDPKQEVRANMKAFRKLADAMVQLLYRIGMGSELKPTNRQKAILARLGIADRGALPPGMVWMAKKEKLARFEKPSRFAHCCFREDYIYAADIYEKAFGNQAFYRLTAWMKDRGYRSFEVYDSTASDCTLSISYVNPAWSKEAPAGSFEYKVKHSGISMRYEPCCRQPWIIGLCIPGGMKQYLEHFNEMPEQVQAFVMSRVKRCDGCRYCVQTDKTGKRPFAKIAVLYEDNSYTLCPYYPGYSFWWTSVDNALADNIIGLLEFMDRFAADKKK